MSRVKRCDESFRNPYPSKKRRGNGGSTIDLIMPQDGNDYSGGRCEATADSDTQSEDLDFSEWLKGIHISLYECINDELEERFMERIKNDPDIFINDIEENIVSIVTSAVAGEVECEIIGSDILSLLHTVIYNSIWSGGIDTGNPVRDWDVEAIAQKTLEFINSKVEDYFLS